MWTYRTTIGTFSIRPYRGGYGLYIADEYLGYYHQPHAAADDVFMCATGYWAWDRKMNVMHPSDLSEWQFHQ